MKQEHFEILLEEMNSKFDIVIEGQQVLHSEILDLGRKTDERFDLVDFKIDTLNKKIDGVDEKLGNRIDSVEENLGQKIDSVATELKVHRTDTEMHHGVYGVKES